MFQSDQDTFHKKRGLFATVVVWWIHVCYFHQLNALTGCAYTNRTGNSSCSDGRRMEIHSLLYRSVQSLPNNCSEEVENTSSPCAKKRITETEGISESDAFQSCAGLPSCTYTTSTYSSAPMGCKFNYVQMNYSCVAAKDIMNMCENDAERMNTSSTVYLAHFKPVEIDPQLNCTCTITGSAYDLSAVYVHFPKLTDTCTLSLSIKAPEYTITRDQIDWVNKPLFTGKDKTVINYQHCDNDRPTTIWLKINPVQSEDKKETFSISCTKSTPSGTPTAMQSSTTRATPTAMRSSTTRASRTTTHSSTTRASQITTHSSTTQADTRSSATNTQTIKSRLTTTEESVATRNFISTSQEHGPRPSITPYSSEKTTTGNSEATAAVTAGSVAGAVLFLITLVCIAILCRKRKSSNLSYNDDGDVNRNSHDFVNSPAVHDDQTAMYNEAMDTGLSNHNTTFAITESSSTGATGYESVEPIVLNGTGTSNPSDYDISKADLRQKTTGQTNVPVYSPVNKTKAGVTNKGRSHLYAHVGADPVEYDHIAQEQTVVRSPDGTNLNLNDDTYHQLYSVQSGIKPDEAIAESGFNEETPNSPRADMYYVLEKPPQGGVHFKSTSTFPEDMEFEENFMYRSADELS